LQVVEVVVVALVVEVELAATELQQAYQSQQALQLL
jgi:hypothetical protein